MDTVSPEVVDLVLEKADALMELQQKQNANRIGFLLSAYKLSYTVYKELFPQTLEEEAHAFARFMTQLVAAK